MLKRTIHLLIVALALCTLLAAWYEAQEDVKQNQTSVNAVAPFTVSKALSNPFPWFPDKIISDLLTKPAQQPSWIQLTQYLRQLHGTARAGYGTQLKATVSASSHILADQQKLAIPQSFLRSLSSLSPPGLVLRL